MIARVMHVSLLSLALVAVAARAQELTVLKTFPGDSGPGPKDNPDNTGAVGPAHVVDSTDANVVIHDKGTGKVLRHMSQTEFWKSANPAFDIATLNDPRLTYDPLAKRWYAVAQAQHTTPYGYLAVSQSADPTDAGAPCGCRWSRPISG